VERVKRSITGFIERRLKLKVNEAKSAVARPSERKFLGISIERMLMPTLLTRILLPKLVQLLRNLA
jgi:RNA-directed DNA polymerase